MFDISLQRAGWCVLVCWDWQAAARAVIGYSGLACVSFGWLNDSFFRSKATSC